MSSAASDLPHRDVRELYQDHHVWLVSLLRRKLGNRDSAADFANDTFVRVLLNRQARPEAPLPTEPRAYLTTIARGLVADYWRRREVERAYLDVLATLSEAVAPSPEVRLLVMETVCRLDAVLDALAPEVRCAFLMAQVEGLSAQEIATRLGVSRATVDRHIACALRQCYFLRYESEGA